MESPSKSPIQRITSLHETGLHALPSTGHFKPLDDYFLQDERQDQRGRKVVDGNDDIGTVVDMLVDPDTQTVAMIELSNGRRVPIEYVRLQSGKVHLKQTPER